MNTHDELRSALQRGATGMGEDQLLTLDDVKGRARGLRRRRAAVAGVATLALVALAVPVGLSLTDDVVSGPELDPARPAPTETIAPPADPTDVLLTTDRPVGNVPPGIDYHYDGEIVVAGSDDPVRVGPGYGGVLPFGDGWLATSEDGGSIHLLDAQGRVVSTEVAEGGTMAVSPDGSVVAYAAPDGRIMTVVAGEEPTEIYDGDGPASPVAVAGSKSCDNEAEGGGCAVWFNDELGGEAMTVTTKGIVGGVEGVRAMTDVSADGRATGIVSADDDGSCSALLGVDGKPAWKTCGHTLGEFSPDGRYVIGYPAYRDGAGDSSLAILDAETGEVLAETHNDETTQSFLAGARWDVDGTVLMPVSQGDTWALMRFAPDGLLVRAVERDFDGPEPYYSDLTLAFTP